MVIPDASLCAKIFFPLAAKMPIVDDCGKARWRPCAAFDLIMSFHFFFFCALRERNSVTIRIRFVQKKLRCYFPTKPGVMAEQKIAIFFFCGMATGDVWRLCSVWHMFNDIPFQWDFWRWYSHYSACVLWLLSVQRRLNGSIFEHFDGFGCNAVLWIFRCGFPTFSGAVVRCRWLMPKAR